MDSPRKRGNLIVISDNYTELLFANLSNVSTKYFLENIGARTYRVALSIDERC